MFRPKRPRSKPGGEPEAPPTPEEARASALRILGRREHSADQLKRKLEYRGHDEEQAGAVVDRLTDTGWQSDTRFAETLARSRAAQGYGPMRIRSELSGAGVADAEIAAAMAALDVDFLASARKTYARHFREPPADRAERQKHYRYLAARGFDSEQIKAVMKGAEDDEGE